MRRKNFFFSKLDIDVRYGRILSKKGKRWQLPNFSCHSGKVKVSTFHIFSQWAKIISVRAFLFPNFTEIINATNLLTYNISRYYLFHIYFLKERLLYFRNYFTPLCTTSLRLLLGFGILIVTKMSC